MARVCSMTMSLMDRLCSSFRPETLKVPTEPQVGISLMSKSRDLISQFLRTKSWTPSSKRPLISYQRNKRRKSSTLKPLKSKPLLTRSISSPKSSTTKTVHTQSDTKFQKSVNAKSRSLTRKMRRNKTLEATSLSLHSSQQETPN